MSESEVKEEETAENETVEVNKNQINLYMYFIISLLLLYVIHCIIHPV